MTLVYVMDPTVYGDAGRVEQPPSSSVIDYRQCPCVKCAFRAGCEIECSLFKAYLKLPVTQETPHTRGADHRKFACKETPPRPWGRHLPSYFRAPKCRNTPHPWCRPTVASCASDLTRNTPTPVGQTPTSGSPAVHPPQVVVRPRRGGSRLTGQALLPSRNPYRQKPGKS